MSIKLNPNPDVYSDYLDPERKTLRFGLGNAKLDSSVITFSIPAGHLFTCPGAKHCMARVEQIGSRVRLVDGPDQEYRCFAATAEAMSKGLRYKVWHNYNLLKTCKTAKQFRDLINQSAALFPDAFPGAKAVRIHIGGDFFSQAYFDGWAGVAKDNPRYNFYAYTKSLPFWVKRRDDLPDNLSLTASRGGRWDYLIDKYNLKCASVVMHPEEAEVMGLEIDHDDSHAQKSNGKDFALLIHGGQPPNSKASKAIKRLKQEGVRFSYNRMHQTSARKMLT